MKMYPEDGCDRCGRPVPNGAGIHITEDERVCELCVAEAQPPEVDYAEIEPHIQRLRDAGYAVVVFNPDEIGETDPDDMCDAMIARGWDVVADQDPSHWNEVFG